MPPRIDPDRCDGCGVCVYECGKYVLALDVESSRAYMQKGRTCVDCFLCEMACPCGAIEMKIGGLPRGREAGLPRGAGAVSPPAREALP